MSEQAEAPAQPQHGIYHQLFVLLRALRLAGRPALAHAALHGQLVQLEWMQEKQRLLQLLLVTLLGFACVLIFLGLLSTLVLLLSWDTSYRLAALLVLLFAHALGFMLAGWRMHVLLARGSASFTGICEELSADIDLLRNAK